MQEINVHSVGLKVFTTYLNLSSSQRFDIEKKIFQYRDKYPQSNTSNVKSWHSQYKTFKKTDLFNEINQLILDKCNSTLKSDDDLIIEDMWVNTYEKNDYTEMHCHNPKGYSCCYYVNVDKNCSPIKFSSELEIIPKNDMFIFFPGNIFHEVPPTQGKRTVISMNLYNSKSKLEYPQFFKDREKNFKEHQKKLINFSYD